MHQLLSQQREIIFSLEKLFHKEDYDKDKAEHLIVLMLINSRDLLTLAQSFSVDEMCALLKEDKRGLYKL